MTTLTAATPTMGGGLMPGPGPHRLLAGATPGTAAGGLSGSEVIRVLRQRLVLIAALFLICTGLTAGFTWFMAAYYPRYYASALIQVKSAEPVNIMNPLERRPAQEQDVQLLVQNQALIVKSQDVLRSVLLDPEIRASDWHRWALTQIREDPVDLLGDIVSAAPIRDSNFVSVAAVWEKPGEAALIANTVVRKYLEKVNELQREGINVTRQQLEDALYRAEQNYGRKRSELENHRRDAGVLGLPQGGGPSEHLLTLEAIVTELDVDSIGRQAQYELLNNARPEDLPITAELQAILQADPTLFQLEAAAREAAQTLALVEARDYGKKHPVVKNARAVADSTAQRAASERAAKLVQYQQEQIEQARRNFLESRQQLMELQERKFAAQTEQRDRDGKYSTYLRLMEEQDFLRAQYEALLEQRNVVDMITRAQTFVQIDVPSLAAPPKRRSSPRWEIWLPVGMLLGLAASMGIALLLEIADKSVRTPRDVPRMPVLGSIPTADDDEVEIPRVETASLDVPHSIIAEAFRNLRANLFFSAPAEQQGVILVTSPSSANGKTTIAANLAISIALSGRRVLLIDANFRRPSIPRLFPGVRQEGLSNILIGQGRLSDLTTSTGVPGCDVLVTGPTPPNPAELLGSSYLRDVIVDARAQYDQVVIDGPPVLLVSDAMVLAGAVDGVLIVCQYRSTSRGALQRTQTQLEAINARVFGAVLNKVETRAGGYFRKAYREFYQYHEPEEGAAVATLPGAAAAAVVEQQPSGELREPVAGQRAGSSSTPAATPDSGAAASAPPPPPTAVPPPLNIDEEIQKLDGGDILTLDDDFKIDDDFDLGEDLGEPRKD